MSDERKSLIRIYIGATLLLGLLTLACQLVFHYAEGIPRDRLFFAPYLVGGVIALFIFPFLPAYKKTEFSGYGSTIAPITYLLGLFMFPIFIIESYNALFEINSHSGNEVDASQKTGTMIFLFVLTLITFGMFWFSVRFGDEEWSSD